MSAYLDRSPHDVDGPLEGHDALGQVCAVLLEVQLGLDVLGWVRDADLYRARYAACGCVGLRRVVGVSCETSVATFPQAGSPERIALPGCRLPSPVGAPAAIAMRRLGATAAATAASAAPLFIILASVARSLRCSIPPLFRQSILPLTPASMKLLPNASSCSCVRRRGRERERGREEGERKETRMSLRNVVRALSTTPKPLQHT